MTQHAALQRRPRSWLLVVGMVVAGVMLGQFLAPVIPPDRDLNLGSGISVGHGPATLIVWVLPLVIAGALLLRRTSGFWTSAVLVGWASAMVLTFFFALFVLNSTGLD